MKKIFAIILCVLLAISVSACGDGKNGTSGDQGGNKNESSVKFYINYNSGVKIELGADANAVLDQLGTPASQSEMGACGDLGTVTKYVYDTIELFVLKSGDKATVDQITLKSDLVKTPEGVTVGSSKDDVISAYGNGYAKCDDNEIRYTSGNKNLKLTLRDGAVIGINYLVLS
jgi:hypothetical protein